MSRHKSVANPNSSEEFRALLEELNAWEVPTAAIDGLLDASRASLNEVKALTEYEDAKVARLLTIIAFLSAVIGAVFSRFANDYAWPGFGVTGSALVQLLPAFTYIVFFAYVILVTWSVYRVLGAVRPKFNSPATWRGDAKTGLPGSMLFYEKILDVRPSDWGRAFQNLTGADAATLKEYYAKNYITETYLVAEKVAHKLEVLEPGVNALRAAMILLIAFFGLYALTIVMKTSLHVANATAAPPTISQSPTPTPTH